MGNCSSCPSKGNCSKDKEGCMVENNPKNKIKYVIGIMSGKGGVGKSTVTALIAAQLKRKGFSVGVLDADITGPSMPRIFGVSGKSCTIDQEGIHPVQTSTGINVMSMNLLTEYEEQAVIWRGPMIAGVVKQFWTDVIWGELDYLLVDMPPGTGDVPLTVMQAMPINGVIMVSTPQKMVSMIVAKAVNMAEKMGVKILGIIENMSYIKCRGCGEKTYIFGKNSEYEVEELIGAELIAELPLDPEMVEMAEAGEIESYKHLDEDFEKIVDKIIQRI